MSKWKIFYTDGTTLKWDELLDSSPKNIADPQRIGVHSVVQEIQSGTMRETIEQYHYIFRRSDNAWLGLGYDGLLDHLVNNYDDILCVLHGRTMALERFWNIKQTAMADTDISGGSSMRAVYEDPELLHSWLHNGNTNYYHNGPRGNWNDPNKEYWTEVALHDAYDERFTESGPYEFQRFYH